MSDDENPFEQRPPRPDRDETFPPRLFEATAPALLGEMDEIAPLLVAGHLLRLAAKRGGSRVRPGELNGPLKKLYRAVPDEVRAHCEAEARLVAEWIEDPPEGELEPPPRDDVDVLRRSDIRSRLAVARWALADDLDLEIEWYDEGDDNWPRYRAEPLEVRDDEEDEETLVVRVGRDEVHIPVVHIRWLMPVERLERHPREPQGATVLTFPGAGPREQEE